MWEYAGIVRHHNGLVTGMNELDKLHQTNPRSFALVVAKLIMQSALARQESRGAQYRSDFPQSEPTLACVDTVICKGTETTLALSPT
jgi:L-aspartate oxidase